MPTSRYSEKMSSLENELLRVKHELQILQSSRSHRIAKFSRNLLSSSLREIPGLLKDSPGLLKRWEVAEPEHAPTGQLFNPLTNSLPLLRHPNINVALVSSPSSYVSRVFSQVCNAFSLKNSHGEELRRYNAVQLVVIDLKFYNKTRHYEAIDHLVQSGAKLLCVSSDRETVAPQELTQHKPLVIDQGVTAGAKLSVAANVYNLQQKYPRTDAHYVTVETPKQAAEINNSQISVLSANLIHRIAEKNDVATACSILERIGSYCPVVVEGPVVDWLPKNMLYTAQLKAPNFSELDSAVQIERYAIRCGREIVVNHSGLNVVEPLLKELRLIDAVGKIPSVSVILSSRRPNFIKQALDQLEGQSLKPYEVIVMLHGLSEKEVEDCSKVIESCSLTIHYERVSSSVLFGDVLNMAVDKATGYFITKVDDDDYYAPNHLLDLYAAHLSSRADFVGKWNNWVYMSAEDKTINWIQESANAYVKHLPGGTVFTKTHTLRENKFGKVSRAIDSELYRRAIRRGATLYSTHRYNYVRVRHDDHTYTVTDAEFKARAHESSITGLPLDEILSV